MATEELLDVPLFMANRVLDNIFVGGCFAAEDDDFIFTNSISRVVNCCAHRFTNRFHNAGVRYLSFQFEDDGSSVMFDGGDVNITQVVRFVNEALERDECVLIHSSNGDSRAVILLAGYLVHRYHWPPHRALQFITTKRFNAKPNQAYVRQLHDFANRRRSKYGEFKDIFGNIRGLKLNNQEILHRNTFLNAVMAQPEPAEMVLQKPFKAIISAHGIKLDTTFTEGRHITWRDGDVTTQVSSGYSNFDANGRPIGSQSSLIFRPRTPSYKSSQQVRCIPVRLDASLLPAISFDLDLPGHKRRTDGYLYAATPDYDGFAVVSTPVSIMKRISAHTRSAYDASSVVVSRDELDRQLSEYTAPSSRRSSEYSSHSRVNSARNMDYVPALQHTKSMDYSSPAMGKGMEYTAASKNVDYAAPTSARSMSYTPAASMKSMVEDIPERPIQAPAPANNPQSSYRSSGSDASMGDVGRSTIPARRSSYGGPAAQNLLSPSQMYHPLSPRANAMPRSNVPVSQYAPVEPRMSARMSGGPVQNTGYMPRGGSNSSIPGAGRIGSLGKYRPATPPHHPNEKTLGTIQYSAQSILRQGPGGQMRPTGSATVSEFMSSYGPGNGRPQQLSQSQHRPHQQSQQQQQAPASARPLSAASRYSAVPTTGQKYGSMSSGKPSSAGSINLGGSQRHYNTGLGATQPSRSGGQRPTSANRSLNAMGKY